MVKVKILGAGCHNCKRLERNLVQLVTKYHLDVEIEKVTDYMEMLKWSILSTPGLVINEKLVSAGRVPDEKQLLDYLQNT